MALVWAPENGLRRIMLSLLVLFAIDFRCKCLSVESLNTIVHSLFSCSISGLYCSVVFSLTSLSSSWFRDSLPLLLEFSLTWVLLHALLLNWLILRFFLFSSSSFALAIMTQWLLLAVDDCISFLICWSVWVLASIILQFNCSGTQFESFPIKYLWLYLCFWFHLSK